MKTTNSLSSRKRISYVHQSREHYCGKHASYDVYRICLHSGAELAWRQDDCGRRTHYGRTDEPSDLLHEHDDEFDDAVHDFRYGN